MQDRIHGPEDHIGFASFEWINEVVVGGVDFPGPVAQIIFPSIPPGYRALFCTITGRTDVAALSEDLNLRFNNDSGANYDLQRLSSSNVTTTSSSQQGVAQIRVGRVSGATAVAGVASTSKLWVPDYSRTTWEKEVLSSDVRKGDTGAGGMTVDICGGAWRSTAVITELRFFGSAGQFVDGTVATLWGAGPVWR